MSLARAPCVAPLDDMRVLAARQDSLARVGASADCFAQDEEKIRQVCGASLGRWADGGSSRSTRSRKAYLDCVSRPR